MYRISLVLLLWLAIGFNSFGQEVKAWKISYQTVFEMSKTDKAMSLEDSMGLAFMQSMTESKKGLPLIIYTTGTRMRIEQNGALSSYVQVSNKADSSSYILYDEEKRAEQMPIAAPKIYSSDIVNDSFVIVSSDDFELTFVNETKNIAGLTCNRANFQHPSKPELGVLAIWYCKDIAPVYWGEYDYLMRLPGAALAIETEVKGMNAGIRAITAEQTTVSEGIFIPPSDYKINNWQED
jgi:GLPGLI family protein